MHPSPSCNGRTRNAVSMSIWVCTRPHYFCPSPDFTTSIVSQSVTNNRCAPSCGGHKRKVRGHIKKFRPALRAGIVPPHLQIASDATASCTTHLMLFSERPPIYAWCTPLPPVNRTSKTEHHWVTGGKKKYIEMFGSFMEPFSYTGRMPFLSPNQQSQSTEGYVEQ